MTPGIGGLTNLTKLSLDNNKIKELPEEIGLLQRLQRIWVDLNQLKRLPEVCVYVGASEPFQEDWTNSLAEMITEMINPSFR